MSPSTLRRLFSYDKDTGALTWANPPKHGPRKAGDPAGCVDRATGYVKVRTDGKLVYAHQIAWAVYYGRWPTSKIDHRDGDVSNNRILNLRLASNEGNARNTNINVRNQSGFKGVVYQASRGKWAAYISNGHTRFLGRFQSPEDAARAYDTAAIAEYGEFACTNVHLGLLPVKSRRPQY